MRNDETRLKGVKIVAVVSSKCHGAICCGMKGIDAAGDGRRAGFTIDKWRRKSCNLGWRRTPPENIDSEFPCWWRSRTERIKYTLTTTIIIIAPAFAL